MEPHLVLAAFALAHLAAVVSPGPSFLVALRITLAGSWRAGLAAAVGMGLGTLVWALGAWFGLAALFAVAPVLFAALRIAGAVFLLWLAVMLWRHAREPLDLDALATGTAPGGLLRALRTGLLTQLSNPKVAVFFGSVFLAILPPDPAPATMAAVFAIVFLNEVVWYGLVAALFAAGPVRRGYARLKTWIDRATGAFLGLLGLRLMAG